MALRVRLFTEESLRDEEESALDREVDYVSLVNSTTHGAPALVAPGKVDGQRVPTIASVGDEVLYINTSYVPAWLIERISDA